ncbi:MAG: Oxidoreductase, NAD-binding [Rhodospirillales bacterium]|nr:Oxidoreductase, NAD-binding [Rhodospirillales bacterium]
MIGLGVQGQKRRRVAGPDFVASVDPFNADADYRTIREIPLDSFDAALCCIPDEPKIEIIRYLLTNGKHVLVEKPLWAKDDAEIQDLERSAQHAGVVCYSAYNHRFEPHFVRMRDLLASGELGQIYRCRMFYGNGTARLVRESDWRDKGAGVLPDLASHLLDTARFWFGEIGGNFTLASANCFENKAPDHVVIVNEGSSPKLELEMTLLQWRNHFTCDILAERGSAHIASLCKWGPSSFIHRRRILPSGRPVENEVVLTQEDPTWAIEYEHFKQLCVLGAPADLSRDLWLNQTIGRLSENALRMLGQS